ncbi:MAG: MFS transporter [Gemmataceae bacterium]|nr:MFS transporter [Gemmataceae bacterium]
MELLPAMMVAALLVGGMGVAILGTIKVPFARRLQIDEAKVGGLVSLFGFAMIPAMLVVGFFTDQVDKGIIFIGGLSLIVLSLVALGWAKGYLAALAGVLVFSMGWSLSINVGNVLVIPAFSRHAHDEAFASNLGNVFFGLGAFLTPLLVTWLLRQTSFPATLCVLAGLALVPVVLALRVDFTPFTPDAAAAAVGIESLLSDPILWLCGFALFFYGPMEASLAAWTTTYLRDQGVKESTAAGMLSVFWLSFMAARLITAFALPAGAERGLILAAGAVSAGILFAMVYNRGAATAMMLVHACGLFFGPIFPTLIAVLLGHFPPQAHGRAVGLLFAIGGVGWTMIPILIGSYAQRTSLQRALIIVVFAAVGLSAVAGALVFLAAS